jgi:rhodanese-related sulfurtransferase
MNATRAEILRKRSSLRRAKKFFETRLQFTLGPIDLNGMIKGGERVNIVDVRKHEDYIREHIPEAINLPEELWSSFTGLSKDTTNVVYCYTPTCLLSAKAAMYFAEHDFPVMELLGGIETWKQCRLPVEPSIERRPEEQV